MKLLDRYVIRETITPFLLALGVFTFVLAVNPMLDEAKNLLAKGVPVGTVGFLLLTLLPQALGVTLPMAFLTGLLMALGRLSGDRESVALLSCGVSPLRLLRPVLVMALIAGGLTMYVLMRAKPDANQAFRETTFRFLTEQSENDIKPRVFFERFPGMVLFVEDTAPGGGWKDVMLADTSQPGRPIVTLAETGSLVVDQEQRLVRLVLNNSTRYTPSKDDTRVYSISRHTEPLLIRVTAESVFGTGEISRGLSELDRQGLLAEIEKKKAAGISPHNEIMHLQQMYSFPAACLVFAVLGLALGLNTRKEGRLAGMALGLAVILAYYGLMLVAQGFAKGEAWDGGVARTAAWARWVPNIVLGLAGLAALWFRNRASGDGLGLPIPQWLGRWLRRPAVVPASRPADGSTPAPARRDGVVVVIRIPHFRFPSPRLLDRYVGSRYLRTVGLAFLGLLSLYYVGTVIDLADKIFKGQADLWTLGLYLWYSTPQFIAFVLPIATLVAVLATIGALTRTGELTVMRACGVSLYRVALPLYVLALLWSGLLFTFDERVMWEANRRASALEDQIRDRTPHTVNVANHNWLMGRDGRLYYYAVFQNDNPFTTSSATLHGLSVFETADGPYRLAGHTYVTRARHVNGRWHAEDGWTQRFQGADLTRRAFARAPLDIEPLEDFKRAQVEAGQMRFGELREYVQRLGASGFNVAEQRVNLHRKLAFPLVTLVMTLIAVPFGVTTGRKGALYGIGLAVILASSYFLLLTFFSAVGSAGVLPAALAAWSANILFMAGAAYMTLTVRT